MKKIISIGTVGFPIQKSKMMTDVDVVELTESRHIPPGKKAATHLLKEMPPTAACTVQISRYFITPPAEGITLKGSISNYGNFQVTEDSMSLWRRQLQFAVELHAKALVMITPPTITPSSANVKAMGEFLDAIDRGGLPIVWEAHGPWESGQIRQFADAHQLIPAVDPLRDEVPDLETAYFRFGAFAATGSRMGVYDLEQIAAAALDSEAEQIFCLFDTHRALDDARNLKKVLSEFGSEDMGEFDYSLDEDGDDDDDDSDDDSDDDFDDEID